MGSGLTPSATGNATTGDGVAIHYEVYSSREEVEDIQAFKRQRHKVLMIMGLAASSGGWLPQVEDLLSPSSRFYGTPIDICIFDNRGIGQSSCPSTEELYSTQIMANDALAVVDSLGWSTFHLVGFSMGGMIASKMASTYPNRLLSLSLLGVTEGRWQALPRSWRALRYAFRMWMAKSTEERTHMDIKFHYTKKTLMEQVTVRGGSSRPRRECLYEEYLRLKSSCKDQSKEALNGQMHACWEHSMSDEEYSKIISANLPMVVLHGRRDLVASPECGRNIARKLGAKFVEIEGAHLINRECAHDVSHELLRIISDCTTESERKRHLDRSFSSPMGIMSAWDTSKQFESDEDIRVT